MCRALVGGAGATNSGTTIGPATPMGARWIWPAINVSWFLLLIWVLNSIAPSFRTLIKVWPVAVDVEPVVSFLAASFACRTHIVPSSLFAGATLAVGAATAQATTKETIRRRTNLTSLPDRQVGSRLTRSRSSRLLTPRGSSTRSPEGGPHNGRPGSTCLGRTRLGALKYLATALT